MKSIAFTLFGIALASSAKAAPANFVKPAPTAKPLKTAPVAIVTFAKSATIRMPADMYFEAGDPKTGDVYSDHKMSVILSRSPAKQPMMVDDFKRAAGPSMTWSGQTVDKAGWLLVGGAAGQKMVALYRADLNGFCTASNLSDAQVDTALSVCGSLHPATEQEQKRLDDTLERAAEDRLNPRP